MAQKFLKNNRLLQRLTSVIPLEWWASRKPASAGPKSSGQRRTRGGVREMSIAQKMADKQKQISISEFFEKNKHFLGFDTLPRSIITAVKEAVDNSLDAAEEARILPDMIIRISKVKGEKDVLELAVEDNGPGIDKTDYDKAIKPFIRLDSSRNQNIPGSGLGLSISQDITSNHGGKLIMSRSNLGGLKVQLKFSS